MKRIVVLLLLIIYSTVSFGISLHYFYCCGQLATVSLTPQPAHTYCAGKEHKTCCQNKTVTIKLKDDQQKVNDSIVFPFTLPAPAILLNTYYHHFSFTFRSVHTSALYKRPPPLQAASRQTLFCVFRI